MIYFYENWYGTAGKGFFQALLKERGGKLIPPLINNQRDFSQQLLIFQIQSEVFRSFSRHDIHEV
jgi:hypothetical protein